jgi:hypothetical protein
MKKSRGKPKGKNFNATTTEEHDKIFNIDQDVRKELNKKEGWVTSVNKKMAKGGAKKEKVTKEKEQNEVPYMTVANV